MMVKVSKSEILESLKRFIEKNLLNGQMPDDLGPDTDLIEYRLLNSLSMVSIIMHVEDTYNFEIDVQGFNINDFQTLNKITEYVDNRIRSSK